MSFKDQEGTIDAPPSLKIFDQALKAYNPWAYESLLIGDKPRKFLTEDNFSLSPATIQLANDFFSRYLGHNLSLQPLNEESLQQQRARSYPDGRILFELPYSRVITGEDLKMGYINQCNQIHKKQNKKPLNAVPIIESTIGNVYIADEKVYLVSRNPLDDTLLFIAVLGNDFQDFSNLCRLSNTQVDESILMMDRHLMILNRLEILRHKPSLLWRSLEAIEYPRSSPFLKINFDELDKFYPQSQSWRDLPPDVVKYLLEEEEEKIFNERVSLENEFKELGPGIDISVLQSNSHFKPVSVSKSSKEIKLLSEAFTTRLAAKILDILRAHTATSSLIALEISYLDGELPTLIPLTQNDAIGLLVLVSEIPESHWLSFSADESFEGWEEFNQMVEVALSPEPRSKMLRSAARQVTELARTQLTVPPDFVAYAINWEMEGDDIAKILKQCGATPATLKNWKKKGWIA
ncbi:MAG: hypothetical protein RL095_769 [Verrucomicrobiota bacterium]